MNTPIRKQVAQLVDELNEALDEDMPVYVRIDSRPRHEIVNDLVNLGPPAVDPIAASIPYAKPKARIELFNALGLLPTWHSILALMRFVFDEKNSIDSTEERGFAMKNLAKLATPSYKSQLTDFIKDIADDNDRWVQAFRLDIIGKIGDESKRWILEKGLNSPDALIREKAGDALRLLDQLETREGKAEKNTSVGEATTNRDHDATAEGSPEPTDDEPPTLTATERKWVNAYRFAEPAERASKSRNVRPERLPLVLAMLASIDEKGTSLALQWILATGEKNLPPDVVRQVHRLATTLFKTSKNNDLVVLAMRAVALTYQKDYPSLDQETIVAVARNLFSKDRVTREAAIAFVNKTRDFRFRQPLTQCYAKHFHEPLGIHFLALLAKVCRVAWVRFSRSECGESSHAEYADVVGLTTEVVHAIPNHLPDIPSSCAGLATRLEFILPDERGHYEALGAILSDATCEIPYAVLAHETLPKDALALNDGLWTLLRVLPMADVQIAQTISTINSLHLNPLHFLEPWHKKLLGDLLLVNDFDILANLIVTLNTSPTSDLHKLIQQLQFVLDRFPFLPRNNHVKIEPIELYKRFVILCHNIDVSRHTNLLENYGSPFGS